MPSSVIRILMIVLLFSLCRCKSTGMEIGDTLPDLIFFDMNEQEVSIYQYIEPEKVLLLHLWGAACCLTYSVPTMKAVATIATDESLEQVNVVSVNLDYPIPRVLRIARDLNISHPMMNDRMSHYYEELPQIRFFFPLSIIYIVDGKGTICGKLEGHQLEPAIRELIQRSRKGRE